MATANQQPEAEGLRQRKNGASNSPTSSATSSSDSEEEKIHSKAPPTKKPKDKSIVDKLFSSKEETTSFIPHIHKTLGLSCLVSFAYRLAHLGQVDGNFGPTVGTLCFVLLHWSLHASSFIFAIPQKRIQDGGYRIWPEMRIHAMVFSSRHLAFILLRCYEQKNYLHPDSPHCLWYMDIVFVLATCAFADLGSYLQRENHSNTIRDGAFSDPFEQWFASQMQIFLTASCLVGYRRYTVHLVALFVIQTNAFLMTLRRKNVASHYVLVGIYSLLLMFGFFAVGFDDFQSHRVLVAASFGGVATILRMGPLHVNKYVMWSGLGLVWWYIRTQLSIEYFYNSWYSLQTVCVTIPLCTLLAWHKRSKQPPETCSTVVGYLVLLFHVVIYGSLFYLNVIRRRGWTSGQLISNLQFW